MGYKKVYLKLQCKIYEIENYGVSKLELINLYTDIEKEHFELINVTTREKFIFFLHDNNCKNFNLLIEDISDYYNDLAYKLGYSNNYFPKLKYYLTGFIPFFTVFFVFCFIVFVFIINSSKNI